MSNQLEVGIGANIDNLKKGLSEAEKALNNFAKETKSITDKLQKSAISTSKLATLTSKLTDKFNNGTISQEKFKNLMGRIAVQEDKLSAKTKKLRTDLTSLNKSANDLGGKGMGTLKKSTVNATSATTAFSRGIQDMPFGIMGVSNNITNLSEQFGYLKKKTGSAGAALKAMGKDMMGAGGLTLAISLITTAWVMYEQHANKAVKETNKLLDAQKDLIGSAQQEITTMNSLLSVAKNETNSKTQRERAIAKLQKMFPDYLSNLSLENVNSKELTENTNKLSSSLIRQAKIKAYQSRLSELYADKIEAESKTLSEQLGVWDTVAAGVVSYFDKSKGALNGVSRATDNQKEKIKELDTEIKNLISGLGNEIKKDTKEGGLFAGVFPERSEVISIFQSSGVKEAVSEVATDLSDTFKKGTEFELGGLNVSNFEIEAEKFKQRTADFNESLTMILENGIEGSLSGIGDSIGEALANGGNVLDAVGESLLSSLGNILTQIGQMAIAIGVGLKAIRKALFSLNPFVAIAAGVGLVALGSFFSSKSKSIGGGIGSSSGGGSSSGVSGGGSYSGGSTRTAPSVSSGFGGGTVVFEIAGNKLVGVLNNTLQRNKGLGGNLSLG